MVSRSLIAAGLLAVIGGAGWELRPAAQQAETRRDVPVPAETSRPARDQSTSIDVPVQNPRPAAMPESGAEEDGRARALPKAAKKEYALLTVASEPWGTLYVGNKEVGPTPIADHPLPLGSHRIRIEQEGYRTRIETIVVTGPNPIRRRYILEPAGPPGSVCAGSSVRPRWRSL
jgi:hypothetical protein